MANQYTSRTLTYSNLDLIGYEEAWKLQHEILQLRKENSITDVFLLLEHPHTYTLGKTADKKNLTGSKEYLEANNISVFEIDRGGDITYHGPGQVIGYPIISLNEWQNDTHKYLRALEEVIILTCKEYGLDTGRNPKYTGVWIENRKIAAIGIKISNWISMHGFAFNVNTDLLFYNGIIPCGITDKEVTSLAKELGKEISLEEVKEKLLRNFIEVFRYENIDELRREEFILPARRQADK
jgi:lipoyl(octanoyl) transferase